MSKNVVNPKWKEVWEKREDNFEHIDMNDEKSIFLELKRIDGFDVVGGGISYPELKKQHEEIISRLTKYHKISSVFEIGCGAGANLYLLKKDGYTIGGIDYSSSLISIANKVLINSDSFELICGEAIDISTDIKYDALFSNSVFSYFPNEEYALMVLDKALQKTKHSIGLIDVHDIEKKEAFENYRRRTVENYDERYKELNKTFYSRDIFSKWAKKNGLEIEFYYSDIEGYWNNEFVFDVYFYKK